MLKKFGLLFFAFYSVAFAAKRIMPQPIFTIDSEAVSVEEFERVYTKNNINNQADYSRQSLEEYLNLYINFKLKVKEAEELKLDEDKAIKKELASYRAQLAKSYLSDKEATETMLKEAYDRSLYEVDASHILIGWGGAAPTSADSARVLKEIQAIKQKANFTDFGALAQEYSEDPSAIDNKGRLGYLTVFQTVYPFESAMYNTQAGTVSTPIATRFGYHLVYVHDKRKTRGTMKTAHILIKNKKDDPQTSRDLANQIYASLVDGSMTFADGVKKHSEDKKTKFNGGELPELGSASMLTEFADVAFALENDGDFSKPVQTSIGWHIIKRISKSEYATYDIAKPSLKTRIERDSRSNVAKAKTVSETKKFFGFKENMSSVNEVIKTMQEKYNPNTFRIEDKTPFTKIIFSIGGQEYTQADFLTYVEVFQKRNPNPTETLYKSFYKKFQEKMLMDYRQENLEEIDVDFKNLMQEYHDGILLFELTDDKVWSKAVEDTIGLRKYHDAHKKDYMWTERIDYTTYMTEDKIMYSKLKKWVSKGLPLEKILKKANKKSEILTAVNGIHEHNENTFADNDLKWEKGFELEKKEGDKFQYTYVNEIKKPAPKKLNETRGYVISDYQNELEKEWIKELKEKYEVQVNKYVLQSLIKK